jgi:hypothetical protein
LFKSAKNSAKVKRVLLFSVSFIGLFLLVALIIANMNAALQLSTVSYIIFRVQPNLDVGYAFHVLSPISQGDPLQAVQFFGFIVVLSAILWASRHFIVDLFRPMRQWI